MVNVAAQLSLDQRHFCRPDLLPTQQAKHAGAGDGHQLLHLLQAADVGADDADGLHRHHGRDDGRGAAQQPHAHQRAALAQGAEAKRERRACVCSRIWTSIYRLACSLTLLFIHTGRADKHSAQTRLRKAALISIKVERINNIRCENRVYTLSYRRVCM